MSVSPHDEHRQELEALSRRRLPLAMVVLLLFIGGAVPIELYYFPGRLLPYLSLYAVEILVSLVAFAAAERWPHRARAIATAWAAIFGLCIESYYPLVQGDATLAMAALICLVSAIPTILPFGLLHQAVLGTVCALGFFAILAWGVPMSLPWPYMFIAFLSVMLLSSYGARSLSRYRWEAFHRESVLRSAHEQLRTALGRAESAVAVRSRLVANVSHELRTPLNVILGYTEILLDAAREGGSIDEAAGRIRRHALSLEQLVSDLLDLSRLSCGRVEVLPSEVDVAALLEEVAQGARRLVRGRAVEVVTACAVTTFRTDRMRVAQILNNLATNAAKFTPSGQITLRATGDADRVVFQVADTGAGIPRDRQESIFTAFEQVTPGSPGGIGLGLAIVRQLLDLLGGTITVASEPGRGATFTVTLPPTAADTESAATAPHAPAADTLPPLPPPARVVA